MHVLLANNVYPPIMAGGAELIVSYLAEELVRRDHRVTVVSTCGPAMVPYPVEQRNGVEVIRFFPKNVYWSWERGEASRLDKLRWHLNDSWNRDAARAFSAILDKAKPDVLHSHLIDGFSASIWRAARRAGLAVVHTAHDYHLICPRAIMLTKELKLCSRPGMPCRAYRKWHVGTTRHIDLFCSPSQFLIDQHRQAGLNGVDTRVVRNGIPTAQVSGGPERRDAAVRLVFPARLTIEKGVRVILEAMRRLPPDAPVRLDIAGKGPLQEEVAAAARSDPRIAFHGYVEAERKAALFAAADCFLLPSLWYENAPVVIIEAAAYGLGVIASRLGAMPEFVKHENTGLLFEPGSAESLAAAMLRLAAEPALLATFRSEGARMIESYTVSRMADAYEEAYAAAQFVSKRRNPLRH